MRFTIGKKVNLILLVLLAIGVGGAISLSTRFFTADLVGLLKKSTLDSAALLAGRIRSEMRLMVERAQLLGSISLEEFKYPQDRLRFIQRSFAIDKKYLGMSLYALEGKVPKALAQWRILNPEATTYPKLTLQNLKELDTRAPFALSRLHRGEADFRTARLPNGVLVIRVGIPLVQAENGSISQFMGLELDQDSLSALFSETTNSTSYLVDGEGEILGSSNPEIAVPGQQVSFLAPKQNLGKGASWQAEYFDSRGERQIVAVHGVGFGQLAAVSQVPWKRAHLASRKLNRRSAFLGAAFLFLALALGLRFSRSLVRPIEQLAKAAEQVRQGHLDVRLKTPGDRRKVPGIHRLFARDEIQQFTVIFNQMVKGLSERQKIRRLMEKFHQKEIVERLLSGEVKLGGERHNAAVLFADIRSFTEMSEGKTPEEIVTLLNHYMHYMVQVILNHGGIVDKYVGDGIMAVWGIPRPSAEDADRALHAVLDMRRALVKVNRDFAKKGIPPLRIGMGLSFGPLVAGNIGSDRHMEYTVIGDTVNVAARLQDLTKQFGYDLLISQSLVEKLKKPYLLKRLRSVQVKGKKKPILVYRVDGYIDERGTEVLIQTPFSTSKPAQRQLQLVKKAS